MTAYITHDELKTALAEQTEQIASMFTLVQEQFDEQNKKLDEHSRILGEHSMRFDAIERRLDHIDGRMKSLENDVKEIYRIITHTQTELKTKGKNQAELETRVDQLEALLHKIAKKTGVSLT